jgi:protein phosphatase
MGGTLGGGEAATAALATLIDHLTALPPSAAALTAATSAAALTAATRAAHERVRTLAAEAIPVPLRPGTTLTAVLVVGGRLHLAHAGDSSAWLLRRGRLRRLTEVHSQGAALVAAGAVAAGSPAERRLDGLLTRFLGMPGAVHPQQSAVRLRPGDRLLVASDGVTRALGVPALATLLARPDIRAKDLVDAAVEAGGRDDATALLTGVDTREPGLNTRYAVHTRSGARAGEVPAR